ncbi:MAG: thiol oxidoreductase, partial [Burkholderiaceae bacterium]|nr:thiol oxidoreductase [Burkholderiaceae bacterium]
EAIPETEILAGVRSTPDADGVKGQANYVYDPDTGAVRLGRFGWKASKFSLRHQAAAALLEDMSVTTTLFPSRACLAGPANCKTGKAGAGLTDTELQAISRYLALVAVPAQRSLKSGFPRGVAPLPYLDVNPTAVAAGAAVFQTLRCSSCHTVSMTTGSSHEFQELRNQAIKPYTDLLLHDMGPGLADNYAEGLAAGNLWRTAPLWGVGYAPYVMGNSGTVGYLHDGRARTLTEAVMWHGGEASTSRQRFVNLSTADRQNLLAFLQSL